MGTLRGKVGDLVFTRLKGKQVMKARNRQPQNNRTVIQQTHRAKIAACMRFFSMAQQNLFKFAFSDQKKDESDINVFIRHNYASIIPQSKKGLDNGCPVFSPVKLTSGSLQSVPIIWGYDDDFEYPRLRFTTDDFKYPQDINCSKVSQCLIRDYGLQQGDILTFVSAEVRADYMWPEDYWPEWGMTFNNWQPLNWKMGQFRVDVNSPRPIRDYGYFFFAKRLPVSDTNPTYCPETDLELGDRSFDYGSGSTVGYKSYAMVALILSRVTGKKLEVSTEYFKPNEYGGCFDLAWVKSQWIKQVAAMWSAPQSSDVAPANILQGSLTYRATAGFVTIEVYRDENLIYRPVKGRSYTMLYIKTSRPFTITRDLTDGEGADAIRTYLDTDQPSGRQGKIEIAGKWLSDGQLPAVIAPGAYRLKYKGTGSIGAQWESDRMSFQIAEDR